MTIPNRDNPPTPGAAVRVAQTIRIVTYPNHLSRSRQLAQLERALIPKQGTVFEQMRRERENVDGRR